MVYFYSRLVFTIKSSIVMKLMLATLISMALLRKTLQKNNVDGGAFYVAAARFCKQPGQRICSRLF